MIVVNSVWKNKNDVFNSYVAIIEIGTTPDFEETYIAAMYDNIHDLLESEAMFGDELDDWMHDTNSESFITFVQLPHGIVSHIYARYDMPVNVFLEHFHQTRECEAIRLMYLL